MAINTLLNRLERVKSTGKGRWMASCPTRNDKTPSLTIRELDDGRILIHDFGGASAQQILDAIGLTFQDLFSEPLIHHAKNERRPFPATDLLKVINFEAKLVALTAIDMSIGKPITQDAKNRLLEAASRINDALSYGGGI